MAKKQSAGRQIFFFIGFSDRVSKINGFIEFTGIAGTIGIVLADKREEVKLLGMGF